MPADRATAERATAEHATADRATANRVTAEMVDAARPASWRAAAARWRLFGEALVERAEELRDAADRLAPIWSGSAADAAVGRLRDLARSHDLAMTVCVAVDQILCEFADRLVTALGMLGPADAAAATVAGTCLGAPDGPRSAESTESAALRHAVAADDVAAGRLADLVPQLAGVPAPPAWIPARALLPTGADPAAVRSWWDALAPADRNALLAADPARLGALDGVPVDVRDRVNRLALARERHGLAAGGDAASLARLRLLDGLVARLAMDRPARAYLLGVDASGDGRAVIAVRDPDRAANVLTYVPGTGSRLANLRSGVLMPATDRLAAHAGPSTSVIEWLGYDAPDNPAAASSGGYAKNAEDALHRFEDGLRATHSGPPAHQTVLGHSYGSTVVGHTARDTGLDADDVIFVGSPGVGVAHAGELGLPAGHVWASTAAYDPIRLTIAGRTLADALLAPSGDDLWFGADPSGTRFGAQVFNGAPGSPLHPVRTHDGYFNETNPAFDTIVDIATGGQPP